MGNGEVRRRIYRQNDERVTSRYRELLGNESRCPTADADLDSTLQKEHQTHQQEQRITHESPRRRDWESLWLLWRWKPGDRQGSDWNQRQRADSRH